MGKMFKSLVIGKCKWKPQAVPRMAIIDEWCHPNGDIGDSWFDFPSHEEQFTPIHGQDATENPRTREGGKHAPVLSVAVSISSFAHL